MWWTGPFKLDRGSGSPLDEMIMSLPWDLQEIRGLEEFAVMTRPPPPPQVSSTSPGGNVRGQSSTPSSTKWVNRGPGRNAVSLAWGRPSGALSQTQLFSGYADGRSMSSTAPYLWGSSILGPILQVRKLRLRESAGPHRNTPALYPLLGLFCPSCGSEKFPPLFPCSDQGVGSSLPWLCPDLPTVDVQLDFLQLWWNAMEFFFSCWADRS